MGAFAACRNRAGTQRILLAGRQESQTGGVLITGDIGAEQAEDFIAADPYQQAGLMRYERLPFHRRLPRHGPVTFASAGRNT